VLLPDAPDACLLLVRTDYSDEQEWQVAPGTAIAIYEAEDFERAGACLEPVESSKLAGLTPEDLVRLPREGDLGELAVADARTMQDLTVLFVDLNEFDGQVGRAFRAIPHEVEPIVANLTAANLAFFEFTDAADPDGVFRGF
jgi:hypothetical protein